MEDSALRPKQIRLTGEDAAWICTDGSRYYVALFNLSDEDRTIAVTAEDLKNTLAARNYNKSLSATYTSLWDNKSVTSADGSLALSIPAHGAVSLKAL